MSHITLLYMPKLKYYEFVSDPYMSYFIKRYTKELFIVNFLALSLPDGQTGAFFNIIILFKQLTENY